MSHSAYLIHLVAVLRWRALAVLVLLISSALLEGAGLLLLVPLLGAIGLDVQEGSVSRLSTLVAQGFEMAHVAPTLPLVLAVFVAVNVLLAWLRRMQTVMGAEVEQQLVHQIRVRLYQSILHMEWLALARKRSTDLTVTLTTEAERVGIAASQLLMILGSGVVTLVYVVVAFRVSAPVTAAVSVCGLVLVGLLKRQTARSRAFGSAYSDAARAFQATIGDDFVGLKTIRGYGAEDRSASRFERVSFGMGAVRRNSTAEWAGSRLWLEVGSALMLSLLVYIAVSVLHFTASALLLLLFLFMRVVPRLAALQQNLQFYLNVLPSFDRIQSLQQECDAAAERPSAPSRPIPLRESLELRAIGFRYGADVPRALDAVSLRIAAGSITAVVGSSGAGKTTLVDVMLALLQPQEGEVVVDGRALSAGDSAAWRASVAYVPQETFLFHDTIRANMLWAVPGASDDDLWRALDKAAAGFVRQMPRQLDTVIGDRGITLSGGERQRIALARALLRQPSVLVLDEATSALDSETEARILETIWRLRGSMTVLIVTHRIAAVSGADVLHVLDGGRLVESGRWSELMNQPASRLRALVRRDDARAHAPA